MLVMTCMKLKILKLHAFYRANLENLSLTQSCTTAVRV